MAEYVSTESRAIVQASLKIGKYPPQPDEIDQGQVEVCGICLDESPRLSHVIEECHHVFCADCLRFHCHNEMEQGTWIIKCPGSGCDVTIFADVLWAVLDEKTFIKQQKKAEEQEAERRVLAEEVEVDWCPRCRAISRVSSEVYSNGRRRADCEKCGYPFCTKCRSWWHGKMGECSHRVWKNYRTSARLTIHTSQIRSEGMDGWEERVKGRKQNNVLSNKLIMDTTTPCPKCHVAIYRTVGCNHMVCAKCNHSFCYGCGSPSNACKCRGGRQRQPPIILAIRDILKVDPAAFDHAQCTACPACHRMNRKRSTDNHIRCVVCKTSFCFTCKKRIMGNVGGHYKTGASCVQHTPIESTITSSDVVFWCQDMYGSFADGLQDLLKSKNPPRNRKLLENAKWYKKIHDIVKAFEIELEELAVKKHVENVKPGVVVRENHVQIHGNKTVLIYTS